MRHIKIQRAFFWFFLKNKKYKYAIKMNKHAIYKLQIGKILLNMHKYRGKKL